MEARAGFYQWLHKPLSDRAIEDEHLVRVPRHLYAASDGVYGSRRVFGDLREAGETCGKNRIERLMRINKVKAVRSCKAPCSIAGRPSILSPNRLNREFTDIGPNQVWITDITYICTWQGWLYLTVVLDLYGRKVVGWSLKPTLSRELALDALLTAVWRRKPTQQHIEFVAP